MVDYLRKMFEFKKRRKPYFYDYNKYSYRISD